MSHRIKLAAIAFGASLICIPTALGSPAHAAVSAEASAGQAAAPADRWVSDVAVTGIHPDRGVPSNCPKGMPRNGPYSCLAAQADGSGHLVIIRYGKSGDSGFGYLHALIDHNLDLGPMEGVIENSANGIRQSNGRYLYGAFHRAPKKGEVDQYVNIFEERGKAPDKDGHELGVVTAYCQGPGHSFEAKCPDWVNETL